MKHAVYYCENCRKPVPLDAEECPHCGSRFTAVQCPQCSFVGAPYLFAAGCPECGYLAPDAAGGPGGEHREAAPQAPSPPREGPRDTPQATRRYRRSTNRLPGWFYTAASVALLAALVALAVIALHLK